jgi:hypothetical protein
VRRWYEEKLTTPTPSAPGLPVGSATTYANLDTRAVLFSGREATGQLLIYTVSITPNRSGAAVVLSGFKTSRDREDEAPLEAHLSRPAPNEPAALAVLRKRLAAALAGWN